MKTPRMKTLIIFSILFAGTYGAPKTQVDPNESSERIVGGYTANEGQFPYQVALFRSNGLFYCGASILDRYHILSAAYCNIQIGDNALAGQTSIQNLEEHGQYIQIIGIANYPYYVYNTKENDIAVAKLADPFFFNDIVSPVNLPTTLQEDYAPGSLCTVSGWGYTSYQGSGSSVLLYTNQNVVDDNACANSYLGVTTIYISMLCAAVNGGGKGPCTGDNGGPLVEGYSYGDDYTGAKQIGIASGGSGCADPNYPGVNTQVSFYLDWIDTVIENSDPCPSCGYKVDPNSCGYISCSTGAISQCPTNLCFNPDTCACEA